MKVSVQNNSSVYLDILETSQHTTKQVEEKDNKRNLWPQSTIPELLEDKEKIIAALSDLMQNDTLSNKERLCYQNKIDRLRDCNKYNRWKCRDLLCRKCQRRRASRQAAKISIGIKQLLKENSNARVVIATLTLPPKYALAQQIVYLTRSIARFRRHSAIKQIEIASARMLEVGYNNGHPNSHYHTIIVTNSNKTDEEIENVLLTSWQTATGNKGITQVHIESYRGRTAIEQAGKTTFYASSKVPSPEITKNTNQRLSEILHIYCTAMENKRKTQLSKSLSLATKRARKEFRQQEKKAS